MANGDYDLTRYIYLPGDPEAISAIRAETRDYYQTDDIDDGAEVIVNFGLVVRGHNGREYEVPDVIRQRYTERRPFPACPIARMPAAAVAGTPPAASHQLPSNGSVPVEGDPEAIQFVLDLTRSHHEITAQPFAQDCELRWFKDGIYAVGADRRLFQVPMTQIEDLVVPRVYPALPVLKMTERARSAQ